MTPAPRPYSRTFFVALLAGSVFQADASAYLDPGSGSMLIQGLIAALAAAGYTIRIYWSRIRQMFGREKQAFPESDNKQTLEHR